MKESEGKFLDFLSGGCELSLCVAIDFSSDGKPEPLHTLNPNGRLNEYEVAIHAVSSILIRYDSDNKVPVWGFGVEINGETKNCFQCGNTVEVDGVGGIIEAYKSTVRQNFSASNSNDWSQVINNAASFAEQAQIHAIDCDKLNYTVLLILSHAIPDDMNKTIRAINASVSTPLSIVIVGVGDASFTRITKVNEECTFVKFREHSSGTLSKLALLKVPLQLEEYFMKRGITPGKPSIPNVTDILPEAPSQNIVVDLSNEKHENLPKNLRNHPMTMQMSELTMDTTLNHVSLSDGKTRKISTPLSGTNTALENLLFFSEDCDFNMCVAIDFTLSNGYPSDRKSLHFLNDNEYEKAIDAVCSKLIEYGTNEVVPLRGFGIEINGENRNCFRMGKEDSVTGARSIVDTYKSVLKQSFTMGSSKDWSVVIENASKFALKAQNNSLSQSKRSYTLLVVFSNGPADELAKTIKALEEANSMPLSVVVVGIGNSDFNEMIKILEEITPEGVYNMISFVNYNESLDSEAFVEAALSKVTYQFQEYWKKKNLAPPQHHDPEPIFTNFLKRGFEFSLCVAIDFSASNGNQLSPESLHHITEHSKNDYEKAMEKMCSMFLKYDSDNIVPVRGFGIDINGSPVNCFQMGSEREVTGVSGILKTYRKAMMQQFEMSASKDWSEIISNAVDLSVEKMNVAEESGVHDYTVLLIFSNGPVDNINATFDALQKATDVPLSVVVVGIGDSDFSEITRLLEGDTAASTITFLNFRDNPTSIKELENNALFEVSHQLEHYFL